MILFLLAVGVGFVYTSVQAGDIDFAVVQPMNEGVDEAPQEDMDDTICPIERKCGENCCREGDCCNEEGSCCPECATEESCKLQGLCLTINDGCYVCVGC